LCNPVELQPLDVDGPQRGGVEDHLGTRLEEPVEVAGHRRVVEVVSVDAGPEQQLERQLLGPAAPAVERGTTGDDVERHRLEREPRRHRLLRILAGRSRRRPR